MERLACRRTKVGEATFIRMRFTWGCYDCIP
jgi:hypothetical protein